MKLLKKIFKIGPKKEDKIEIWADVPGLVDVIPVQESSYFMPDWFLKTPRWSEKHEYTKTNISERSDQGQTIKQCPAVPEFMSMGITVPLWCDLQVTIPERGPAEWHSPWEVYNFRYHDDSQFADYLPEHAKPTLVLKPDCPWRIKTPPGVLLLQLPMFWHFNPIFTVAAGVIWSEFYHEINQQMMFHNTGEFLLKRGTPLAQYIPIRRETFNYDIGDQTDEQKRNARRSFLQTQTKYRGGYSEYVKKLEKCPHHNQDSHDTTI